MRFPSHVGNLQASHCADMFPVSFVPIWSKDTQWGAIHFANKDGEQSPPANEELPVNFGNLRNQEINEGGGGGDGTCMPNFRPPGDLQFWESGVELPLG